jgi:hypothetical protein
MSGSSSRRRRAASASVAARAYAAAYCRRLGRSADAFFEALEDDDDRCVPKFAVERLRVGGRPITVAGLAKARG